MKIYSPILLNAAKMPIGWLHFEPRTADLVQLAIPCGERFWVELVVISPNYWIGKVCPRVLTPELAVAIGSPFRLRAGDFIYFHPDNVFEVQPRMEVVK